MHMQRNNLISKKQIWLGAMICFIAGVFYCYKFVLSIVPGVLQTELSTALGHVSATTFGQISALYYFAYSPMQMPVGMLMDRFGPRKLLTFACLCCTIGSWMFTLTYSIMLVSLGRFLMGFGSSFAFVGVLSLTIHWLPRRFFSLVVGLVTTMGMLGLMYGEVKITQWSMNVGWERVLLMIPIIGAVISVIMLVVLRDGPEGYKGNDHPLPEFFRNVFKVLKSPEVWIIGFVGACLYTPLSVFGELWGKTYLIQAHHLSPVEAAKTVSAVFLGWAVGAPIAGYLSDHTGRRLFPLVTGAVLALICISLVLYLPGLSPLTLKILLFLYGIFTAVEIIVFIMAKECSGAELSGTVFAATNMIVTLGGVIFQPLVGKLLDTFGDSGIVAGEHIYTLADYQIAMSVLPISLLMVTILAFFIKDHS